MLPEGAASSLSTASGAAENGPIILTGCGSSYYLSAAVSPLWGSKHPAPVRAISATELLTYPEGYMNRSVPGTLIAVSRWGKSIKLALPRAMRVSSWVGRLSHSLAIQNPADGNLQ